MSADLLAFIRNDKSIIARSFPEDEKIESYERHCIVCGKTFCGIRVREVCKLCEVKDGRPQ